MNGEKFVKELIKRTKNDKLVWIRKESQKENYTTFYNNVKVDVYDRIVIFYLIINDDMEFNHWSVKNLIDLIGKKMIKIELDLYSTFLGE